MINDKIAALQNGDEEVFPEILAEYGPLIDSMISKYKAGAYTEEDDLRQEAAIALFDAARTFDGGEKVTFGLYAKICIRNRLISYIRKNTIMGPEPRADAATEGDPERDLIDAENGKGLEQRIGALLSEYEKAVFRLYISGMSYAGIGERLGKNRKSVDNAISRIKSKLAERQI